MSSPQVIDSTSQERQLREFFRERAAARFDAAGAEAEKSRAEVFSARDGKFDTTSAADQLGRPLTHSQIAARLARMNPALILEQTRAYPEMGAVYLVDPTANPVDLDPRCRGRQHIVGMTWGVSPEFTSRKVRYDDHGTPNTISLTKGWRDVLKVLIKRRLVTPEQCEREFAISRGRESARWYEMFGAGH